jgi:hypothetical protein
MKSQSVELWLCRACLVVGFVGQVIMPLAAYKGWDWVRPTVTGALFILCAIPLAILAKKGDQR